MPMTRMVHIHLMSDVEIAQTSTRRACHLFDGMVEAHYVRDKGNNANQWLVWSDGLRVRVRVSFYSSYTVTLNHFIE